MCAHTVRLIILDNKISSSVSNFKMFNFFKSQNISSLIKFMYNKILAFMITNKYIRFFIKYTFIIYLFGTIDFCNLFFIILVKYKNSLTFQKSWNELII